jgi:RHS repeat-associated protein
VVLTQTFDAAGNRTSLSAEIDSTDDFLNTFTYDNLNRVTRITQVGQAGGNTVAEKRVDFAYNAAGQFTAIDRYKDIDGGSTHLVVETAYTYDLIGRLTDLVHTHDTTDIADYHWDYDAFGRITAFAFAFSDAEDGSSAFSYDATGQLTAADHTAQADESFSYDENGNRTMGGYDTGGNNLLLSDGVFDYVYDGEGNRISRTRISNDPADDKTVEYEWDHRNRLIRVVFKDNSNDVTKEVIYEYDSFDRRITKVIDADGAGIGDPEQTDFIYDGQNIVLALDDAGDVTNRYLHGPAIDMVLADEQVYNELLWTLTDNQGSVRDLVDNSGEVESHIDYSSFGKVDLITDDLVQTLYGFTGRERDAETGLNYHRARYYDPVIGRWLSDDPISFAAGDSNIQRYVGNDPVNFKDPTGHEGFWSDYWHFLTNPSDMDDDLETAFYVSVGVAGVAGAAAGGLAVAGYGALSVGAAWAAVKPLVIGIGKEVAEYYFEEYTGIPVIVDPADVCEQAAKYIAKHGGRQMLQRGLREGAERLTKTTAEAAGERAAKDTAAEGAERAAKRAEGGCFVEGTDVALAGGNEAVFAGAGNPTRASFGAAALGAAAIGAAGCAVINHRKRDDGKRRPLAAGAVLAARKPASMDEHIRSPDYVAVLDGPPTDRTGAMYADWQSAPAPSRRSRFGTYWLVAWLLLAAGLWFGRSFVADEPRAPAAAVSTATARITKPIEQIEVGERVAVDAPTAEQDLAFGTTVDPATWRRVTLRAPKRNGGWADVVLLRPAAWLSDRGAAVGGTIEINVPECGINGQAEVRSIGPCPPIAGGNGRIVTGTFHHRAANIIDLHVAGLPEPIGTTANHPFWSIDRQSFVRADSLQSGERLRGAAVPTPSSLSSPARRPSPSTTWKSRLTTYTMSAAPACWCIMGHRSAAKESSQMVLRTIRYSSVLGTCRRSPLASWAAKVRQLRPKSPELARTRRNSE